jgi:hypothetical protein
MSATHDARYFYRSQQEDKSGPVEGKTAKAKARTVTRKNDVVKTNTRYVSPSESSSSSKTIESLRDNKRKRSAGHADESVEKRSRINTTASTGSTPAATLVSNGTAVASVQSVGLERENKRLRVELERISNIHLRRRSNGFLSRPLLRWRLRPRTLANYRDPQTFP